MKKIKRLSVVAAIVITSIASLSNAATIINGGKVYFKGEIVNAACAVDSESINQTVPMGQVKATIFKAAGDTSDAQNFSIRLNNCDTSVSKNAAFSFLGTTTGDAEILSISGTTAGGARNVGISIYDVKGEKIKVDGSAFGAKIALIEGNNVIPLKARYVATAANVTAGQADAVASFNIQYD